MPEPAPVHRRSVDIVTLVVLTAATVLALGLLFYASSSGGESGAPAPAGVPTRASHVPAVITPVPVRPAPSRGHE